MRVLLLLLVLAVVAGPVRAQTPAAAPVAAAQYCTLVATGNSYAGVLLQLDYGRQASKYFGSTEADEARADQAAILNLFTVADALNYLAGHGWECVGVSTLSTGATAPERTPALRSGSTLAVGHNEVQYLLRRRRQ